MITDKAKAILLGVRPANKMKKVMEEIMAKAEVSLDEHFALAIDNEPYMRLCVELVGTNRVSVAHYYYENGDACCDPDMEFLIVEGNWYPVMFQNSITYREHVKYDENYNIVSIFTSIRDAVSFANTWATNIKEQGFIDKVEPKAKEEVTA